MDAARRRVVVVVVVESAVADGFPPVASSRPTASTRRRTRRRRGVVASVQRRERLHVRRVIAPGGGRARRPARFDRHDPRAGATSGGHLRAPTMALVAALVADPPPPSAEIARIHHKELRAPNPASARTPPSWNAATRRRPRAGHLSNRPASRSEMAVPPRMNSRRWKSRPHALEETLAHLLLPADEADDRNSASRSARARGATRPRSSPRTCSDEPVEMFARKTGWRFELVAAVPSETGGVR